MMSFRLGKHNHNFMLLRPTTIQLKKETYDFPSSFAARSGAKRVWSQCRPYHLLYSKLRLPKNKVNWSIGTAMDAPLASNGAERLWEEALQALGAWIQTVPVPFVSLFEPNHASRPCEVLPS